MNDSLKKLPSIRIQVIEIPTHVDQALGFLRSCIDLKGKGIVPDCVYDRCLSGGSDFGGSRATCEGDLTE